MAKENELFAASRNKLQALCDENMLTFSFSEDYPITLTVRPQQGMDAQLAMLEMADETTPFNSPNASIVLSMVDGALQLKLSDRFTISDAIFSKIKGLFVKMHAFYLQAFHRNVVTNHLISAMPDIGSALTTDKITEPLEEYDDDLDDPEAENGEAPDFPEDLLDEADEAPESEEITYGEYLFKEAAEFAREKGFVTLQSLMQKLNLTHATASKLIDALAEASIINDVSGPGGARKYIGEDEDNG